MFRCKYRFKFRFMPPLQLPPPIPSPQRRFSLSSAAFAFSKLSLKAVSNLSQRPASFKGTEALADGDGRIIAPRPEGVGKASDALEMGRP
ncbi:hypothetical protein ACTTAI_19445 [Rhodobacter capsulatus]|uniref:hypothetical protein n=1 Tax=Rhodobacter capsulatus TaxID=1061 RepID=UPI0040291DAB